MCIVFITVNLVLAAADTLENKSSQYLRQFKIIDRKLISNFSSTAELDPATANSSQIFGYVCIAKEYSLPEQFCE